jgi:hypothetical protein
LSSTLSDDSDAPPSDAVARTTTPRSPARAVAALLSGAYRAARRVLRALLLLVWSLLLRRRLARVLSRHAHAVLSRAAQTRTYRTVVRVWAMAFLAFVWKASRWALRRCRGLR